MPELPEVETVRRMLEASAVGRTILRLERSRRRLHVSAPRGRRVDVRGRAIEAVHRRGKFLLIDLSGGLSVISHLGMSGRWLFYPGDRVPRLPHVHVRITFADGTRLWYQDPRRFGMFRVVRSDGLGVDPSLKALGPDPLAEPPSGVRLSAQARGLKASVKSFLLDQRRIAGIGNIYASEILHRARVHPGRRAGAIEAGEWERIASETKAVLDEAIARMGTTFRSYRTLWNEPGSYGDQLMVYDRAGKPCRRCRSPIRRIVQGQRATFYCQNCQPRRPKSSARN